MESRSATISRTPLAAYAARFVAVCAGLSLIPAVAAAQSATPPGQFPPVTAPAATAAPAPAPAPQSQSVVLVAMTGDEAVDKFLRSTADELHQRLRARGFADVEPARVSAGIAADPSAIATLRARLGASCMVRVDVVSHSANHLALSLTVQTEAGDQTAAVDAPPAEIPAKVVAAVEPLLPAAAAVPAAPVVPAGLDRIVLKDGTTVDCHVLGIEPGTSVLFRLPDGEQRKLSWSQVAQILPYDGGKGGWGWAQNQPPPPEEAPVGSWAERGGSRVSFDVQGQIVGVLARLNHPYLIEYPDGQSVRFTGESPSGGGGGGIGLHVGFLQLAIPEPTDGNTIWGLNLGTGVDLGVVAFGYRTDSLNVVGQRTATGVLTPDKQEGGETKWASAAVWTIPLVLGGQVGLGHFEGGRSWQGVTIGLDWRPTYTYVNPSAVSAISSFNYLGIGAHIDVGSLAVNSDGPEPNFRFSAVYLPAIDDHATIATLGFGAVWY